MNVGSLFSGIGGLDEGLRRAGHRHVFFCEGGGDPEGTKAEREQFKQGEYRRAVLRARFPGVPVYDDVRNVAVGEPAGRAPADGAGAPVDGGRWEAGAGLPGRVDLLTGGFPCQDLSVAGRRAGLAGDRSGLFFEFARIAAVLMPKWLLLENVPGLLSSNDGADFHVVLDELQALGYIPEVNILNSMHFGVPQRRRRVFFLCVHVEHGRRARSPISLPMLAQALFEISALTLIAATAASITVPGSWGSRSDLCVDGLRRRMTLFGATSISGWRRLLDDFIAALRRSASERDAWAALSESARFGEFKPTDTWSSEDSSTADASVSQSIESSLRKIWDDLFSLASECITSTSAKETTDPRISTCAEIVLTISECIAPLTRSFPLCWNADSSGSTAREVVTSYARQTTSQLFGDLDGIQFWLAALERAERLSGRAHDDPRAAAERAGEVLAVGESCLRHSKASGEAGLDDPVDVVSGTLGGRRGFTGDDVDRGGRTSLSGLGNGGPDDNDAQAGRLIAHSLTSAGHDASEDGTGRGVPLVARALTSHADRQDGTVDTFIAAPLTKGSATGEGVNAPGRRQEDDVNIVAFHPTGGGAKDLSPTDDLAPGTGTGTGGTVGIATNIGVRRLTPTECERLQGLPDGWTQLGDTPDSKRYSALGDAVTATVSEWLGLRLAEADG